MASEGTTSWITVGLFFLGLVLLTLRDLGAKRSPGPTAVVYVLAVWPIVFNLNASRYVTLDQYTGLASMDLPEWQESLSAPGWVLTGVLMVYVVTRLLSGGWRLVPLHGLRIWGGYLLFVSAAVVAGLVGNPGGGLTHALFRPHLMISAVMLGVAQQRGEFLSVAKWGSLAWIVASLLAAVIAPDWAMFESGAMMDGPLPFPRLYGVGANPNGLAPVALLFLYLEYFIPSGRFLRLLGSTLAVAVIVMTQSKTIWGIAVVSAYVLYVYRRAAATVPARLWVRFGAGALAIALAIAAAVASGDAFAGNVDFKTLTGRTVLWSAAFTAWASSPIFGYGPTLWNEDFRAQFLRTEASFAGHSHNLYVQQLAESGLVGFVLLLLFLGILAQTAWTARHASRGLSLALLLDVLISGVTESNLGPRSMGDSMFAVGVLLALMIACSSGRQFTSARLTDASAGRAVPFTAPASLQAR